MPSEIRLTTGELTALLAITALFWLALGFTWAQIRYEHKLTELRKHIREVNDYENRD